VTVALLLKAYRNASHVDPGFDAAPVMTFRVSLPDESYDDQRSLLFWEQLRERVAAVTGVRAAGVTNILPMSGHSGYFFEAEGALPRPEEEGNPVTLLRRASPGYAAALGLRVRSGRWFTPQDRPPIDDPDAMPPVVVNETFARHYWGEADPVGRRVRLAGSSGEWAEVIGLIQDTRHYGLETEMRPGVFLPLAYMPSTRLGVAVAMEDGREPAAVIPAVREIVHDLDPSLPVYSTEALTEIVDGSLSLRRAYSTLLGVFAGLALLLALGGLYGVVSYSVGQRLREIGIRMAMGASTGSVLTLVLGQGLRLAAVGALSGIGLAVLAGGVLDSLLYEVSPYDPLILALVTLVLAVAAAVATVLPAARAARVDPARTLRLE
jgi:predicted permease